MKGLITLLQPQYEDMFFYNLKKLRNELNCHYPIEVWSCGNELSLQTIAKLQSLKDVYVVNTEDFEEGRAEHWRGWQAKGIVFKYTRFDEGMFYDSDIIFYQSPSVLFNNKGYKKTGAFFFRDMEWLWDLNPHKDEDAGIHPRYDNKFKSMSYYRRRQKWIKKELPHGAIKEWNYLYTDTLPTSENEAVQESGVVVLNKKKNWDAIDLIYRLNDNHKENQKYQHGDKELWWIAFRKIEKDFTFNDSIPDQTIGPAIGLDGRVKGQQRSFYRQYYNGELFFSHKEF